MALFTSQVLLIEAAKARIHTVCDTFASGPLRVPV